MSVSTNNMTNDKDAKGTNELECHSRAAPIRATGHETLGISAGDALSNFIGHSSDSATTHQEFFNDILALGMEFKTQAEVKKASVPTTNIKCFSDLPINGVSYAQLIEEWRTIAAYSTNWASPNFMGFPDSGNAVPALGAAMLIPFLNQNLANQDICAPSASFVEMEVVHWLRQQLGYTVPGGYASGCEIGGVLTLGGCLSNTVALMAAREHTFPGAGWCGLPVHTSSVRVLVPDVVEHYSIRSAMAWLSLGEQNVVRIPVDNRFRMRLDELDRCIDREREMGNQVIACVAYAGDSRSMCIDNLDGIAECLQRKNVWFHVDACHGSQLAFSSKHREKLRGLNRADSVTIDPHKVLWISNTCSFVLFKDPKSLANISTNSDLILKTQWSLGQITPCIGSKAFDALKLWSTIKFFGQAEIGQLIDRRLELTGGIQAEIMRREDLVLLNDTDINSCMLLFVPRESQGSVLSAADLEKVNLINKHIKIQIAEAGEFYLHGFPLKSCAHGVVPEGRPIYVLRTMNGNPLTTMDHVTALLDRVEVIGRQFASAKGFKVMADRYSLKRLAVVQKLMEAFSAFLEGYKHVVLIYGSSTCDGNSLLSDIDVMIFAQDDFCTAANRRDLIKIFINTMKEEGIAVDAEVPFERKLLVSFSFARAAASFVSKLVEESGRVPSIVKTTAYLHSDEMLYRLVFNVLTVPNFIVSGSEDVIGETRLETERALVRLIREIAQSRLLDADEFIRRALTDGTRAGEDYLGYKDRPEVVTHLRRIFQDHLPTSSPETHGHNALTQTSDIPIHPACLLFLNGFPGVGKLTIARALQNQIRGSRLLDNHLLIDPVQAIEPGRSAAHYALRTAIRKAAFEGMKKITDKHVTLILTSCSASTLPGDVQVFAEFVDIARARGVPFVSVNVLCNEGVNVERLKHEDRMVGKSKLTDSHVLLGLRGEHTLLDPRRFEVHTRGVEVHHMDLDTTESSVDDSAQAILKFLSGVPPAGTK